MKARPYAPRQEAGSQRQVGLPFLFIILTDTVDNKITLIICKLLIR
jgi:hypothetical protein